MTSICKIQRNISRLFLLLASVKKNIVLRQQFYLVIGQLNLFLFVIDEVQELSLMGGLKSLQLSAKSIICIPQLLYSTSNRQTENHSD